MRDIILNSLKAIHFCYKSISNNVAFTFSGGDVFCFLQKKKKKKKKKKKAPNLLNEPDRIKNGCFYQGVLYALLYINLEKGWNNYLSG